MSVDDVGFTDSKIGELVYAAVEVVMSGTRAPMRPFSSQNGSRASNDTGQEPIHRKKRESVMKKGTAIAAISGLMMIMGASVAQAQSDAMEDAYDADNQPMESGSGVTDQSHDSTDAMSNESGHSAAADDAMDSVDSETAEPTDIDDSEALDDINADGQSDAAAEAQKSQ
ncbi:hypothetical protein [Salinicola rhizosphaerae]|nr:hypothetical protein [Salinicola rhizosphaerae]